jgi:hypothetical protein
MTFMSTCSGPITGQVAGKPALKFLGNPPKGPRVGHESLDLDEERIHTSAGYLDGLVDKKKAKKRGEFFGFSRMVFGLVETGTDGKRLLQAVPASRRTHRGQQLFENCDARHAFGQLMSLSPALCLPAVVIKTGAGRRLG